MTILPPTKKLQFFTSSSCMVGHPMCEQIIDILVVCSTLDYFSVFSNQSCKTTLFWGLHQWNDQFAPMASSPNESAQVQRNVTSGGIQPKKKKNDLFLKKPKKISGRWIITLKLPCFISFTHFTFPSLPSVIKVQMDLMCIFKNFQLHYCFDLSKHKRKIIQHGKVQIKKILCRPLNLREFSPLHL